MPTLDEPKVRVTAHHVTFQRNTRTGDHRAICTCGWGIDRPTLLECQLRASTHDIEWQDVE
jgi:hypothetical protein